MKIVDLSSFLEAFLVVGAWKNTEIAYVIRNRKYQFKSG